METKYHSIAASILSLSVAIIGSPKLELTAWWHVALAVAMIVVLYGILFLAINIMVHLYKMHFQRANIESNEEIELRQLNNLMLKIYCLHAKYKEEKIECAKEILRVNISALYKKAMGKILFIERSIESPTLKHKFDISKETICNYKKICSWIKNEYKVETDI